MTDDNSGNSTRKIDVALIFALREEYELAEFLTNKSKEKIENRFALELYKTTIFGTNKASLSIISLVIDDQGPEAAAIATSQFLTLFAPKLIISLGISGRVSNECMLGDVVIASTCENSLYRAKLKPDGTKSAGRVFSIESPSKQIYAAIQSNEPFYSFDGVGAIDLEKLKEQGLIKNSSRTHFGPICSSTYVVDDHEYIKWLQEHRNRNLLATDMESSAVVHSAVSHGISDGRIIVIRGISDSPGLKSVTDGIDAGVMRRIAMRNAAELTKHTLSLLVTISEKDLLVVGEAREGRNDSYNQLRRLLDGFSASLSADGDDESIACREIYKELYLNRHLKSQMREVSKGIYFHEIHKEYNKFAEDLSGISPVQKDFLIAHWIMNCLVEPGVDFSPSTFETLDHVYPRRINRFCKAILGNVQDEKKLVEALLKAYEYKTKDSKRAPKGGNAHAKAHVCYLLGRVNNDQLKRRAIDALINWRRQLIASTTKSKDIDTSKISLNRAFSLLSSDADKLLLRTISISLTLLGSTVEAEKYVKACLRHKHFDSLNRGFHLEYYGDIDYDPRESMNNVDNLESCEKTFFSLFAKLAKSYSTKMSYKLRDVELQTLLSLVQQRHAAGRLPAEQKEKICDLLLFHSSAQLTDIPVLRSYCELLREHLQLEEFSRLGIVRKLYELKKLPRSGWNDASKGRTTANPESVFAHTMGGLILIQLCLPNALRDEDKRAMGEEFCAGYSKSEILLMFLVHDLAEAYTGDLLPKQRDVPAIEEEDRINSILDLLGTYPDLEQFGLYRLCSEFNNGSTVNAKIAKEIDYLENLVQLQIELRTNRADIPDASEWHDGLVEKIVTPVGKRVLSMFDF